jgi:hypothetical protein
VHRCTLKENMMTGLTGICFAGFRLLSDPAVCFGQATHHMAMHADLDRKTRQFGNQSAQQGRPLLTESDIKEAQRRVEEARQRSELVGQRIREEMERFVSPAWGGHLG